MVDGLHRVVITGLGAVTPIGNTVQDYWNGLTSGINGVEAITLFDACLLYTSPSPRDGLLSRMPSSA